MSRALCRPASRIAIVVCGVALAAMPGLAATFTVNSTADAVDAVPGDGTCATATAVCTLRAAVQEANALLGADTINLPAGTYTFTIPGSNENNADDGDLDIDESLTLTGTGSTTTIIDAASIERAFEIYDNDTVVQMTGLMIQNCLDSGNGGAIHVQNNADLILNAVTIRNCSSNGKGGAIEMHGGDLTATNSTLSGNSAKEGGGIFCGGGIITLTHVTIANNTGTDRGAGIDPAGTMIVKNTIVADNLGSDDCDGTIGGTNNLDSDGTCGFALTGDPRLGPLQDNGGLSFTHALLGGSAALDAGAADALVVDQRGATRPADGDGSGTAEYDIGAYEASLSFQGTVFEDLNYGGGAGRNQAASSGVGVAGARVELYDAAGTFLTFTTTGATGNYGFPGLAAGNYTVRAVNNTVPSSRAGWVGGVIPVQTYRTDASSGTAVAVTDRVGGEVPEKIDAGNGSTTLAALTTATTAPQSIATVAVGGSNVSGVDFGFNFNTVVSTNATGQGSLRQFLTNSNALGNAGLAIVGQVAGKDVSIFMIPDGAAHPGLRAGLTNQLNGSGVAVISPTTALPPITAADTTIDGTTQTANVGNTNGAVFGTGGTVGVDSVALGTVAGPEVEIADGAALPIGLHAQANDTTIRGLAIHGFGTGNGEAGIVVADTFTGTLIEDNVLGSSAHSFTDPGAGNRNYAAIDAVGGDDGTIRDNLIGFGEVRGIYLQTGADGWLIQGNEIQDSGFVVDGDGIAINDSDDNDVVANLIVGSSSQGYVVNNSAAGNDFVNNTVTGNGVGTTTSVTQSAGITFRGSAGTNNLLDRNVVYANYGAGLQVNDGATGVRVRRNSFYDNGTIVARDGSPITGQIGIDLNAPGDDSNFGTAPFRTRNDSGDGDTGGNALLNFPILSTAIVAGGNLTLTGFARPGSLIEVFLADPDPSDFGEGLTHAVSLTEGGTGAGGAGSDDAAPDDDGTSGAYSPPVNGIDQGSDTTNRFSFTVPLPAGVTLGSRLTATATLGGSTSEFGGLVDVSGSISGTVHEDVDGDADLGDGVPRSGVTLHVYEDDGDDVPDAGDTFIASTTTDGSGTYTLQAAANATHWIVVDSTTVTPSAGLNAPFAAGHAWAEQTRGPSGGWCANGSGGDAERGSAGPCYAGRAAGTSDVAGALTTAQHIARVAVATSNVTGVDFAFSFKVITNTGAATEATPDSRSGQGSLDQALANANALVGSDALRFVPALAPDDGSGNWWRIDYTAATEPLEDVFDTGTVLDGTAYCAWNDGTQGCGATTAIRDTNTSGIGANVAVGVNGSFTTPSLDPELEIVNEGLRVSQATAGLVPLGFEVRNLAIRGDTIAIDVLAGAASLTGLIVERNVLGSAPGSFSQPGTIPEYNLRIGSGTACQVRDNLVGFSGRSGINLGTAVAGCVVTRNEVRGSGKTDNTFAGVLLGSLPSTVEGNLITDNQGFGVDTVSSGGGHTLRDNTITLSGLGGVQTGGIRLVGTGGIVERNVIETNTGPGVLVAGGGSLGTQNRISDNRFGSNSGPAIDLVAVGGSNDTGDGITLNDGTQLGSGAAGNPCGTVATSGNLGLDFPVLDSVMLTGAVSGRACVGATVEVYRAVAGTGDSSGGTDHGEGTVLLGTATANVSGDFSLNVGTLLPTDVLTTIAIDGSNNTSEFSANRMADALQLVKRAYQLDGTPIPSGSSLPTGLPVQFLIYVDNPGGVTPDIRIQDVLDPLFAYQTGTMQVDNSYTCLADPCDATDEAAILAAVSAVTATCHGSGAACTDAADGDIVRYDAAAIPNPTLSAGGTGNAQLDLAADKVWALLFRITIQ